MYPMKMKCGGSGKLLKMLQAFYFAQGMTMTACCFFVFVHFFLLFLRFPRLRKFQLFPIIVTVSL